ncbi:MAG: hypothetical protein HOB37_01620 [Rhodospirillaceae bacterium]|jgi:hypothetical protein|nr:hypothetical protein [Rhodospirillaceae bacterium]MBT5297863.1 hypothetical protein [Rhodospirillaceae bacterium]MBT5515624.1 hypothetical protein [Rhodospirillaceae bacterium]MBT6084716.1 hypothetical protein [Rhodospirillaceae bacterium]MBT6607145.1 hypothetical protein [Rhodospirillaceae bacterium]
MIRIVAFLAALALITAGTAHAGTCDAPDNIMSVSGTDHCLQIEAAAARGAVGIAMMRPGYTGDGRTSSGLASRDQNRDQIYSAAEFDSVGAAVAALKAHHKAGRVVMIGHSGGAANAGVLLGSRPDIVDAVILIRAPVTCRHGATGADASP